MNTCAGCDKPEAWCDCQTVLGYKVRLDERMGRNQVGIVNGNGHGVSIQDGEITPFIMPADGSEREGGKGE